MRLRHATCLAVLLLLAGTLSMTEYRAAVFYANGTQSIYEDRLLVNSSYPFGSNISYAGRSFYVPGEGSYVYSLPPRDFNLSVVVREEGGWISFRVRNNHSFTLNLSANISVVNGSPVCGNYCTGASLAGGQILANFSLPAGKEGVLFILPVSTVLQVGRAEVEFSYTLPARLNRTMPLILEIKKRNVSDIWQAVFSVINPSSSEAVVRVWGWYELNGSATDLFNVSLRMAGNSSWSTLRSVVSATAPVFYLRAVGVNTSKAEVEVVPAYPVNLSSPGSGLVYGRALVLANVSLSTPPSPVINITSFSTAPRRAERYTTVEFTLVVENSGTSAELIEPEVEIYSGTSIVGRITFLPVTIPAGGNLTLVSSYLVDLPEGNYQAVARVYYRNRSGVVSSSTFFTVFEEAAELEEVAVLRQETPRIRFAFLPVLIEGKPGDTSRVAFEVENPSESAVDEMRLTVDGLPAEWVNLQPERVSIGGGENVKVNLSILVPLSALPGDHRVVLRLSNGGEEARTFFIFRIKPYPVRLEKPAVLREVYIDEKEENTQVRVRVENSGVMAERLEIVEEIPKEIASNVAEVRFKSPVTVIEADPVVAWRLTGVEPYEAFNLEYEVTRVADRYSPYIYWPLRQINLFYTAVRGLDLLQFSGATATYARPGETAEVRFSVVNPSLEALNLSFRVAAPPGWAVSPEAVVRLLPPGYLQELVFRVTPPAEAVPGSYTLTAIVSGDDGELSQPLTLILLEEERRTELRRFLSPALVLGTVLLLAYLAVSRYRKRQVYRREVVEAVGRIRERMERE